MATLTTTTMQTAMKNWYVLNYVAPHTRWAPASAVDDFNKEQSEKIELFAPTIRHATVTGGKVIYKERPMTYHYVFARGTLQDIKHLCSIPYNGFSLMLDRGSEHRYGIVSDAAMESFRIIARLHDNTVPFYNIEDIQLEEGDVVEIAGGEYAGLKGIYMPKSRSNKGNLVIAATDGLGAIVWNIEARYVRILEFACDTRRQYDILDSFIPRFYPILLKYHKGENLEEKEKSLLSVFAQRMGIAKVNNHKLEAKLAATLMAVSTIIGDIRAYQESRDRYERRQHTVTNLRTRAYIDLLLAIIHRNTVQLRHLEIDLKNSTVSPTAAQRQLLDAIHIAIS